MTTDATTDALAVTVSLAVEADAVNVFVMDAAARVENLGFRVREAHRARADGLSVTEIGALLLFVDNTRTIGEAILSDLSEIEQDALRRDSWVEPDEVDAVTPLLARWYVEERQRSRRRDSPPHEGWRRCLS